MYAKKCDRCGSFYIRKELKTDDVSEYHYEINFNPKMWLPYTPTYID